MNLGYACINTELRAEKIFTSRTVKKATLDKKGYDIISELVLKNIRDLLKIINWNIENNILFFRISSDTLPWGTQYKINELRDSEEIICLCKKVEMLKDKIRLTMHPGPYNVLASKNSKVVDNTIKELCAHSMLMDALGLENTPYNKINIHIGGAYGDKKFALDRFAKQYNDLPLNVKNRLTVENDDKKNMYKVSELIDLHEATGIPIVLDIHHHKVSSDNMDIKEALRLCSKTWPKNIKPVVHYSESRDEKNKRAHSDFINGPIQLYENDVDVMIEAKMKEQALLLFRKKKYV